MGDQPAPQPEEPVESQDPVVPSGKARTGG